MKNLILTLSVLAFSLIGIAQTNTPDASINLALDAKLTSNILNGKGNPIDILYNPKKQDYEVATDWNEHGTRHLENLGPDGEFFWSAEFKEAKFINYITFGGCYANQPQVNTLWKVSYRADNKWIVLGEGKGGWVNNSGIFVWGGENTQPIIATAVKVDLFTDGKTNLVSPHVRARGGVSNKVNDSKKTPKASLIQLLDYVPEVVVVEETELEKALKVFLEVLAKTNPDDNTENADVIVINLKK